MCVGRWTGTGAGCCCIMERSFPGSRVYSMSPVRSEARSLSPSRFRSHPPLPLTTYRLPVSSAGVQGVGYVCRPYGSGQRAIGLGTLIAPGVLVTARAVVHTEACASRSYVQLSKGEFAPLRPEALFLSLPELRVALIGVEVTACKPVDIVHRFTLERNAVVRHIWASRDVSKVKMVESKRFFFQSDSALLAGTPAFDQDWHFQGITVTPSSSSGYNEAVKVDSLLSALLEKGHLLRHSAGLKAVLAAIYFAPRAAETEEHILWFEWLSGLIHCYSTLSGKWSAIAPGQGEYLWGCKAVELPDGSYLLLGGMKEERAATQVLCYSPSLEKVTRVADMHIGRVACGVAYCLGSVYAIGGENAAGSCESYPLQTMQWSYISSLQVAREAINAASMGSMVYVAGGLPLREAGRSVERYGLAVGLWERLPVTLPEPVCNSGLVAVDGDSLAILGGRHSKRVLLLHLSNAPLSPYNSPSLHDCPNFQVPVETQYPVYSSALTGLLYLFNSHESQHKPWVVTYSKADLYQRRRESVKRTASKLLPNLGIR